MQYVSCNLDYLVKDLTGTIFHEFPLTFNTSCVLKPAERWQERESCCGQALFYPDVTDRQDYGAEILQQRGENLEHNFLCIFSELKHYAFYTLPFKFLGSLNFLNKLF